MIKKQYALYLFLIVFTLSSCSGNSIYVDVEQQCVKTCSKKVIKILSFTSTDDKDCYTFNLLPGKNGTATFDLRVINTDYSVDILNGNIDLNNFQLRPEMEYEVENHSDGDAGPGKVMIRTDKNGLIQYASKTSCD